MNRWSRDTSSSSGQQTADATGEKSNASQNAGHFEFCNQLKHRLGCSLPMSETLDSKTKTPCARRLEAERLEVSREGIRRLEIERLKAERQDANSKHEMFLGFPESRSAIYRRNECLFTIYEDCPLTDVRTARNLDLINRLQRHSAPSELRNILRPIGNNESEKDHLKAWMRRKSWARHLVEETEEISTGKSGRRDDEVRMAISRDCHEERTPFCADWHETPRSVNSYESLQNSSFQSQSNRRAYRPNCRVHALPYVLPELAPIKPLTAAEILTTNI